MTGRSVIHPLATLLAPRPSSAKVVILAALLSIGASATGGCAVKAPADAAPADAPPARAMAVRVSPAEATTHVPRVVLSGDLEPDRMAMVGFALGGTLEELLVRRGDVVKRGQSLGRLGADVARAQLAQARAGLAAAEAQRSLAEDAHQRVEELQGEGAASAASLRQTSANRDLGRAQVDAATAQLAAAETALGLHSAEAPIDGLVTRAPDGPGISVQAGMPLFVVERTEVLVLKSSVSPSEATDLRVGTAVRIVDPERGVSEVGGRIRLVLPSADPMTHRVPVEVEVPNAQGTFFAHSFVRGEVVGEERAALAVPGSALTRSEGGHALWVRDAQGQAARVPVRLLDQRGEQAIVLRLDGMDGALDVIVRPDHDLVEGRPIGGGA